MTGDNNNAIIVVPNAQNEEIDAIEEMDNAQRVLSTIGVFVEQAEKVGLEIIKKRDEIVTKIKNDEFSDKSFGLTLLEDSLLNSELHELFEVYEHRVDFLIGFIGDVQFSDEDRETEQFAKLMELLEVHDEVTSFAMEVRSVLKLRVNSRVNAKKIINGYGKHDSNYLRHSV